MIDSNTGAGTYASRIPRSRRRWRWTVRLLPAVLACAFAGAGQARDEFEDLNKAVDKLTELLVLGAKLEGREVLVRPRDFFEMGSGRSLPLSKYLARRFIPALRRHGATPMTVTDDENRAIVLRGEWDIESGSEWLYLFLEIKQLTEGGRLTTSESREGWVPIANIGRKHLEPDLKSHGRFVVRQLETDLPGDGKYRLRMQPFKILGQASPEEFSGYLHDGWRPAFTGSRRFTLVGPDGEFDGELDGTVRIEDEYVKISLLVSGRQGQTDAAANAELDKELFRGLLSPGVVGTGDEADKVIPIVTRGQPVPDGGEATDARLARCAGHVGAKRRADAVKCYAHVLKEAPGDKGALAGLEGLRGTRFRDCPECPELVVVPSGSFMMGAPPGESGRGGDEGPMHEVTIGYPIAVGVYEVMFGEWDACADGGGCGGYQPDDEGWGGGNHPVINVNWNNAKAYVRWLSRKTGEEYRLLSEAEWEYVARAGTRTPFHTGATISTERANYNGNHTYGSGRKGRYIRKTVEVGSFPANRFGLHDVHGNVWEWVEDCYSDGYEGAPTDGSAWEWNCGRRVLRGGSWYGGPGYLRSAYRNWSTTSLRDDDAGIRVARTLAP